jgi:hypothetical protein
MRRVLIPAISVGMLLLGAAALRAAPVQWTKAKGGNGHYYEAVDAGKKISFATANAAAEAAAKAHRGKYGNKSYLVAINSKAESDFVLKLIDDPKYWHPAWAPNWSAGPWNGAIQPEGSPEPDGNWKWTSGEPMTFTSWGHGPRKDDQQPNNGHGGPLTEDRACFYNYSAAGAKVPPPPGPVWCDLSVNIPTDDQFCPSSYVIEYVTEPSSAEEKDAAPILKK